MRQVPEKGITLQPSHRIADDRQQTYAVEHLFSLGEDLADVEKRRVEINRRCNRVGLSSAWNGAGPSRDAGDANAAFVERTFLRTKRGVRSGDRAALFA